MKTRYPGMLNLYETEGIEAIRDLIGYPQASPEARDLATSLNAIHSVISHQESDALIVKGLTATHFTLMYPEE